MIDLRQIALPSRLVWDGGACDILTDYRLWIEFGNQLAKESKVWFGVFPNSKPPLDVGWIDAAIKFWKCENEVPRITRAPHAKTLDILIDGNLIVASFQQAYGIDLTSGEYMHWHRFKALLEGLPDDTKLVKVMGYRAWTPADDKREHKEVMAEQKAAWALPGEYDDEDETGGFDALIKAFG